MLLNLNVDYKLPKESKQSNIEISCSYIETAISLAHEKMEGQMRRIFGRLQRKLDEALDNKSDSIELEEAEKDLIVKSFDKVELPSQLSKYVIELEKEIEKLIK